MNYEEVKERFTVKKILSRNSCMCTCPAHKDDKASLCISEGRDGKVLLYCFAGCSVNEILSSVGLSLKDISNVKELTCFDKIGWYYSNNFVWKDKEGKEHKGYGDGVRVTADYRYYDEFGRYIFSKLRIESPKIKETEGKLIRYYYIDYANDEAKSMKPKDAPNTLYRLPEFLQFRHKAEYVYIVEGEKDCEKLRSIGSGFGCVTTSGGANTWQPQLARYFKGLKVIILRDNDKAGKDYATNVARDLRKYAHYVAIVNPSELDHGDVTDYLTKEGGTAQSLHDLIENNKEAEYYANWIDNNKRVNTGILADNISENEYYCIVRNQGDDKDKVYFYINGVYRACNKNDIKAVIKEYIPISLQTDNCLNNVFNLIIASNDHVTKIEEIDKDERYINFKNGLYDIESRKLVPHNPEILTSFQCDFNYDANNNHMPVFKAFINDLCRKHDGSVDESMKMIIQEYLGFIVSNVKMSKIKAAAVLWSRNGNTGKSVTIRLFTHLTGSSRVASIKLAELKPENRFILETLPTSRIIVCGDESNQNIKDSSLFKALTGGDPIKIEPKNKAHYTYIYGGGFVIACNGLPCFEDDKGNHLYDRLIILPCEHHIRESEKDASLSEKLEKEEVAIMNWALEGLHRLIDNGYVFTKSEQAELTKEEYREQMDNVYRFVKENYIITGSRNDMIQKSEFDDAYHSWCCKDESIKAVDKKNISGRMESLGVYTDKTTIGNNHGIIVYRGIKKTEDDIKANSSTGFSDADLSNTYEIPFD